MEAALQARIPGARGQPHTTIRGGGHFLQEDRGEELARVVVDFVRRTGGLACRDGSRRRSPPRSRWSDATG